jgi:hypothetical protein
LVSGPTQTTRYPGLDDNARALAPPLMASRWHINEIGQPLETIRGLPHLLSSSCPFSSAQGWAYGRQPLRTLWP